MKRLPIVEHFVTIGDGCEIRGAHAKGDVEDGEG